MDVYEDEVVDIVETKEFRKWFDGLKDCVMQARISERLVRLKFGWLGDWKTISKDITELRFKFSPGFRIYIHREGNKIIVLLNGGDKSSQQKDIKKAEKILKELQDD